MRRLLTVLLAAIVSVTVVLAQGGTGTTQLVGAEYFYDTDPGYGQATYINNVTEGENSLTLSVDGLSPGAHMLYVRSLESSGLWSATQSCPILLTPQRADNVARVEYFFDTDPGYGLGLSVSATNGENVLPLSISGMAAGIHHLNMRSQDAAGNWSPTLSQSLFIVSPKNANVQRIEYFFDTDPGYGQATAISGAQAADATYALPLDRLSIGAHLLCVRAQDNHGRWSSVVTTPLFVTGHPANAVAAEYFLDANDPGVGQATPVTLPADLSQPFVIAAATDGLNPGEHTITIRVLNDLGFWTTVVAGTTFAVTEPTVVTPEAYAVLSADSLTVTFYYDSQRASRSGAMDINTSYINPYAGDSSPYGTATQAIIDPSFADYRPTSTYCWFQACDKLVSVSGMEYLHTDNVTDMGGMFDGCSSLTSLDVSGFNTANVTDMSSMFSGCSGLTSLDVSNFNTENVIHMGYMFSGCSGLTSLDVSNFNTENVIHMGSMFFGCTGLTSLDVSGFNTANVTDMSYMFQVCSNLTSLDVSRFNTAKVTDMSGMFSNCSGLTSLDVSGFNTANVTSMYNMFSNCSGLTSLDVSGFNTANVTAMEAMFYGCSGLTSLDVSRFNTAKVTDMSSMFQGCSSLTSLDVSGFNTANVTDMNYMFYNCSGLTSLDLSGFNTANVNEMGFMFFGCTGLTSLDVSGFNTANVTDMSGMFSGCSNLVTIYAGEGWSTANVTEGYWVFHRSTNLVGGAGTAYDANHVDYTYAHIDGGESNPGYLTDKNATPYGTMEPYAVLTDNQDVIARDSTGVTYGKTLTFYYDDQKDARGGMSVGPFNEWVWSSWYNQRESITTAEFDPSFANCTTLTSTAYWFSECKNLVSISGIQYLKTANVMDMSGMFGGCSLLTSLDVSGFNTAKVTNMSEMFRGCSGLTSLDVSRFNTDNVTNMYEMFYNCSGLTSLDVSGFNTANVTVMQDMFFNCSGLTNLDVSGFNTANVTTMLRMFEGCSGLTSLDVTGFNTANVKYMYIMFGGCSSLTSLDVSGFNTANVTNMSGMFQGCSSLTSLDVSRFNTANVKDMSGMFQSCSSLTSLDVSRFNTANVTNMSGMFYYCTGLTSLDVSGFNTANVTYMRSMFRDCSSLTSLDVSGFNTANVTDMRSMFYYCTGLTSLDVSGFNTANVMGMGDMFSNCSGLTSLDVSGFNTANVTDMRSMFSGCSNLVTIYAGEGWSTANVTEGYGMFERCTNLVGGAGTTYDANHVDYTYAHIDGGTSNPGYLTDKNASSTYKVMIAVEGNGEVSYGEPTTITGGREVETTVDAGGSLELFFFPGEGARLASVMVVDRDVTADVTPASENGPASYILNDINNDCWIKVIFENVGPVGEAEFDGLVARVSGERTLDEAFAEVGGRFEAAKTIAAIVWNKDTPMTDADLQGFNNPNMLVYVENPSFAPSSAKNVVVNGRIQSLVLTDEGDNNNFFAPQPFTAEQISYTHEYIQQTQAGISRGWESIALPFTVQTITHESHGQLRPFALSGSGRPFWLRQLTSNGIIDVTGIEANTPYIISMPNNPTYRYDYNQAGRVTFAAVNATVESSYDTRVMSHENIEMVPAFYAIATGNNCYAINRSEPREGYPEGSVFELNLRTVRPFEAYTLHLGNNPLPRFLPIADMNTTTGIADITSGSEGADVKIYSLSGVIVFEGSLSEAQMKLPAGVYIIDGKKTLIK